MALSLKKDKILFVKVKYKNKISIEEIFKIQINIRFDLWEVRNDGRLST